MNKVLTIFEVRKLKVGAKVWVEHRGESGKPYDGVHTHSKAKNARLLTKGNSAWDLRRNPEEFGNTYRVWALPSKPTAKELTENPDWPVIPPKEPRKEKPKAAG
ncbi:MAG: hypothetical protein VB115_10300 [Christensenellaceae bacterium]|nr:hypothetical protein [Christensenellaceae bacterium]